MTYDMFGSRTVRYDAGMLNANRLVGTHDVLFVTLDTLRYDVAASLHARGRTPNLSAVLPASGWENRHTPGSFTFAAHAAFFAGFLPTPAVPGKHARLFALRFPGSETTSEETAVFDSPDIVAGFRDRGYHTLCVGGVGFFNKLTPLGNVLPSLFDESHWSPELGVTDPRSTENQVNLALRRVAGLPPARRVFLFVNVSAIHQPNRFYLPGASDDSIESHGAALEYADRELGRLFAGLRERGPWLAVICSDHGTAYGEDGYTGHRARAPGRVGRALRRVRVERGYGMIAADLHPVLQQSAYQGYVYAYPHKTAYRPLAPRLMREVWAEEPQSGLFLYVHVPFCTMRCGFCNLFTTANPKRDLVTFYLDALRRQAAVVRDALPDARFARLAIGGGTPTYLNESELAEVFDIAEGVMGATSDPGRRRDLARHADRGKVGAAEGARRGAREHRRPVVHRSGGGELRAPAVARGR